MPNPNTDSISFKNELTGRILSFLTDEGWECAQTTSALVEIVANLADYREEGEPLFPKVFICDDIERMVAKLGTKGITLKIGNGPKTPETIADALKKCAQLAGNGWSIFILRQQSKYEYGVFIAPNEPTALDTTELLTEIHDTSYPVILVSQLAHNVVEIRGSSQRQLFCHLSALQSMQAHQSADVCKLADVITVDVNKKYREQINITLSRSLDTALRASHGSLVAVISHRRKALPKNISDAVILSPPISLQKQVVEYLEHRDIYSMMRLKAVESLMAGMIRSDGIVVFTSDARIVGYRAFLRSKRNGMHEKVSGGARRRAYDGLACMIGHELTAAFIRSEDGRSEFKRS
jgi:hypothetical protein